MEIVIMWIVAVAIAVIVFFSLVSSMYALIKTRVPVIRTPKEFLDEISKAINLTPGQTFVDLGCSDARTLLSLCRGDGVRGRGYELNGPVWVSAWMKVLFSRKSRRVRIFWQDFFRCELEDVDVVFCYLMPGTMSRVGNKCAEEMSPGSLLVSFLWEVPQWVPKKVLTLGLREDPLYVYEISRTSNWPINGLSAR